MVDKNTNLQALLKALDDSHATDVTVMDVSQQTSITDYMLVCTGRSSRHVKAVAEQVMQIMKDQGVPTLHSTGLDTGDWALIDFGDFVVHVMQPDARSFYDIEGLWQEKER